MDPRYRSTVNSKRNGQEVVDKPASKAKLKRSGSKTTYSKDRNKTDDGGKYVKKKPPMLG